MEVPSVVVTCCNGDCGISFAVPQWWNTGKRNTHSTFYCPNGHRQSYMEESDEDKLRRERDLARQQIARVQDEAARARRETYAAQKETKRLKRRAAAGTCPCCSRTVLQMARHMKTKHPGFVAEETAKVIPLKKKA